MVSARNARWTSAIKRELVRFKLVAGGHQLVQITGACINVSDLLATVAVKVMMVVLMDLISIRLAWQGDHINDSVRDQAFDVSVNRSQAEVGHSLLCFGQQFLRQKRPPEPGECFLGRGALSC